MLDVAYQFIQRNRSGIQRNRSGIQRNKAIIRRKWSRIQRKALSGCSISIHSTKSKWNPPKQSDNPTKEEYDSTKGWAFLENINSFNELKVKTNETER
ncbi:hypothetical protein [Bacillus sp. PS06]|uniref:hypothetical protein n=1 Tax=Bacillus sp. PS06 TaxID=2764176 RepID=UPI001785ADEB|nr:hypothetical protein [Bacillus sp. PS06]MBD8069508.1 hypothetical protein [Bacillus sp. PS06]